MQQINLYQPIFRKERKRFSALALLQISLAACLLMVAIGVYFQVQLHRLQANEQALANQHRHLEQTLAGLRDSTGQPELEALDRRIAELERQLAGRDSLLAGLSRLSDRESFSPVLQALGQQRLAGLWLTGLTLGPNGQEVQLRGVTLEPGLVPRYLEQLGGHPRLRDLDFQQVQLQRRASGDGALDFSLATRVPALTGGTR